MVTTFEAQKKIQEAVQHYVGVLRSKGYSFEIPPISFRLKGAVAGKGGANILKFNLDLASRNLETFLQTTVPHEIAHVIQLRQYPRSKAHGNEWKFFCKVLTGHLLPLDRNIHFDKRRGSKENEAPSLGASSAPYASKCTRRYQGGRVQQ